MVTHGNVIFKYKGIYYTFYNHSDSYISYLGSVIINEIRIMIKENRKREYKNLLLHIPLKGSDKGDVHIGSFYEILNYPESFQYFTSNKEEYSEYTYIIDFDKNKFTINRYCENIYIFNLNNIPKDWYEITENNSNYEDDDESDDQEDLKDQIKELEEELKMLKAQLK